MAAVFDGHYVRRISGRNLKPRGSKMDHAEMLIDDIRAFKVGQLLATYACRPWITQSDPEICPSQIYAYAAIKMGVTYTNGAETKSST